MSSQDTIVYGGTHPEINYRDGQCCPLCMSVYLYAPSSHLHPFTFSFANCLLYLGATLTYPLTNDPNTGIGYKTSDSGTVCVERGWILSAFGGEVFLT
jgi:hypothetical protein